MLEASEALRFVRININDTNYKIDTRAFMVLKDYKEFFDLFADFDYTFIMFLLDQENADRKVQYEYEYKEFVFLSEYAEIEYQEMMNEDPNDYYKTNNTDFDDATIKDAFEGDQDNTWNVD